jgi:hypothetical protein
LTLEQAQRICEEIRNRYGIMFSEYKEETRDGDVKLVSLTIRFWINGKVVDIPEDL